MEGRGKGKREREREEKGGEGKRNGGETCSCFWNRSGKNHPLIPTEFAGRFTYAISMAQTLVGRG